MVFTKALRDVGLHDIKDVGGKTASLGQMIQFLSDKGVKIPQGFAITAQAYWHFLKYNDLANTIKTITNSLNIDDLSQVSKKAQGIRDLISKAEMPPDLAQEIIEAYNQLSSLYHTQNVDVAVRSSATAEDLPGASFAGQQESFLHIKGQIELIEACKKCFASLFTDRAIIYRATKGFNHQDIALSIVVQKMVRSDLACSGVAFSLDTETGFKDLIIINAAYGLGEAVVQGIVNPDEYHVFKTTLNEGFDPIIRKSVGSKNKKLVYDVDQSKLIWTPISDKEAHSFCLTDTEICSLAHTIVTIENYYTQLHGTWSPMDIEWAKDGIDGTLYIVQARPETVHSVHNARSFESVYTLQENFKDEASKKIIVSGQSIGTKIASGHARLIKTAQEIDRFERGDILITQMTDPDWVPLMQKAGGIITEQGGRTCHAAIVSRELGIPAIVGAAGALSKIQDESVITLDCSQGAQGYVYKGNVPFTVTQAESSGLAQPPVNICVNVGDPNNAFVVSQLPHVSGVGLARVEFIIVQTIKAHPMVFTKDVRIDDAILNNELKELTSAYQTPEEFFIDSLAQGIGSIAAAFYPRPIIVRFSDFKTNEYRDLLGGSFFEPVENNPMLGLRGASRYYNALYEPAFALECAAIKRARETMGLINIIVMIPFVRTVEEAQRVIALMERYGLKQGEHGLKIYMMVEIPSNVLLIEDFCNLFDGFSIGSNDLTQTTLAVDRDSALLAPLFDERDKAVKKMCEIVIKGARACKKPIGICGQAPSDYPEFAQFLIDLGINSLSLNPDSVIPFLKRYS